MRFHFKRLSAGGSALAVVLALGSVAVPVSSQASNEAAVETGKLKFKVLPGHYHSKTFRVKVRNPDARDYDYNTFVLKRGTKTIRTGEIRSSTSFELAPGDYKIRQRAIFEPDDWWYVSDFPEGSCSAETVSSQPDPVTGPTPTYTVTVRIRCADWDGVWGVEETWSGLTTPTLTLDDVQEVPVDLQTARILKGQWVTQNLTVTPKNAPWPTFGEFKAIRIGMTLQQVKRVVGSAGRLESKGTGFQIRTFYDDMSVTFLRGRVDSKIWY